MMGSMPTLYLHRLTGRTREESMNRHLACFLAFIAGAADVGGLLALGQYTSHVSGVVAGMAAQVASGSGALFLAGLAVAASFLAGAVLTTLLVRWGRRHALESEFALPLVVESLLLLAFSLAGRGFARADVGLLAFAMGLQNAMITKISDAVIRTTHLTGMVTDIGIALGRIASPLPDPALPSSGSELSGLRLHASLVALFFCGGCAGAAGFRYVGFLFALPLALVLFCLAAVPVVADLRRLRSPSV